MDKRSLESEFGTQLSLHGFRKKGSSWYRQTEDVLQLVNLQKSSFGMQCYVNLCYVPVGMQVDGMPTPKEHKCPIRIRLAAAFPEQKVEIERVFDLEVSSISKSERKERIANLVRGLILPFLAFAKDVPSLRQALQHGKFKGGSVNLAVQRYLGLLNTGSAQLTNEP